MKKEIENRQAIIMKQLLIILNAGRQGKVSSAVSFIFNNGFSESNVTSIINEKPGVQLSILTADSLFVEACIGFTEPLQICDQLSKLLGIPEVPYNQCRLIPTTEEIQDIKILASETAITDLTISQFAEKVAKWLCNRHPNIALNTPQSP